MSHTWTREEDAIILRKANKVSFGQIGEELGGLSKHQVRGRYLRLAESVTNAAPKGKAADEPESEESVVYAGEGADAQSVSVVRVKAVDQKGALEAAIAKAKIDTNIWQVDKWEAKLYEGFFRSRSWQEDSEKKNDWRREATVIQMWSVKLHLVRKAGPTQEEVRQALIDDLQQYAPKYPAVRRPKITESQNKLAFEISVFDLHAGKLCWYQETGTDYDLKIAERLLMTSIDTFLYRVRSLPIETIVLPLGNDFFHVDNDTATTNHGTLQDVDSRWQKSYVKMKNAMVTVIERCREVAPVKVLVIPGNHDKQRTFYLGDTLQSHFHRCPDVEVDNRPTPRKYFHWGVNLIGFTHGDEERHASLPLTMAKEVPQEWAASKYQEWHLGHFHKKQQKMLMAADTVDSVVIRTIPSLSGTDAWHAGKAYASPRAAEAFLWDKADGYFGHFSYNYFGTREAS